MEDSSLSANKICLGTIPYTGIHDYPGPRLTCSHSLSRLTSQDSCEFGLIRSRSQIPSFFDCLTCEVDPDNKTQWKSKLIKLKRFQVRFNGFGTRVFPVFPVFKENLSPDLVSGDLGIICCCHQLLSTHLEFVQRKYFEKLEQLHMRSSRSTHSIDSMCVSHFLTLNIWTPDTFLTQAPPSACVPLWPQPAWPEHHEPLQHSPPAYEMARAKSKKSKFSRVSEIVK